MDLSSVTSSTRTDLKAFDPQLIPPNKQLIVTTREKVYSYDREGVKTLFESRSRGLVAAKLLNINDNQLVIADSQVVVIQDGKRRQQKSLRLKNEEVRSQIFLQKHVLSQK